jgi:hypothetical protein
VDYLDTKFKIHLAKGGPVVIVLSQLDDRYYQGLEGQYEFHLQFRLHKDDEEDYIVRSNGTYYMKRSVSTELDLEAGNYTVLLKIKATRNSESPTPDEVIRKTCTKRREKLLSIGLSYDIAHAKGQFREQENENAQRRKEQKVERKKEEMKQSHERRKKLRRKADLREKRKAAKESRRLNRCGDMQDVQKKLQDFSGLGIAIEEENRVLVDDEGKLVRQVVSRHHRASSTGSLRERSDSPNGGFQGRGGYNKGHNAALSGTLQSRGGIADGPALQGRGSYNHSTQASPSLPGHGFQGRGGYNQNMPGDFQGRGGYNQNMPGEFQGRGGYNVELPGAFQGRDGYNEGQLTDSPNPIPLPTPGPTPFIDEFRPGTPSQRTNSPRPSPAVSRRQTLTPIPGVRPGIHVRGISISSHRAQHGMHTPDDISDASSWDSDIDGPCSLDSGLSSDDEENIPRMLSDRQPRYVWYNGQRYPYVEDEDEFEADPWNAVCVVGLRLYSKDNTDVTIEVHNGEGEPKKKPDDDDASVASTGAARRKEKELDVDDSAADATSPLRTRGTGLDDALQSREQKAAALKRVGTAPAGMERSRQGTLS